MSACLGVWLAVLLLAAAAGIVANHRHGRTAAAILVGALMLWVALAVTAVEAAA